MKRYRGSTVDTTFLGLAIIVALTLPAAASADDPVDLKVYDSHKKLLDSSRVYDFNTDQGQAIFVEFDDCKVATLKITETERQLRIYEDISTLVNKIIGGTEDKMCSGKETQEYKLKYKRATVKIVALEKSNSELAVRTLITGPKEHLSLGVDLPVTSRKSLKYDSTSKTLVPQDTNPQLYLSVNGLIGDVLEKPEKLQWFERIEFKLAVLASRRPLDSYGVAVGYRVGGKKILGMVDLKGLSIFGGYFVTKQDDIVAGTPQLNRGKTKSWLGGVSYDLGTGLGWVKF